MGQFEIRLNAHRALAADAKSFSVSLPQPQASVSAAAIVAVLPADNVEIIPAPEDERIAPATGAGDAGPALQQQEPLFYRSDSPQAVFAAEIRRHHRRSTVGVNSQIVLGRSGRCPPASNRSSPIRSPTNLPIFCCLQVPRDAGRRGRLELSYEDQVNRACRVGRRKRQRRERSGCAWACRNLASGGATITARYVLPPGLKTRGDLRVPLVMPLDAEFAGNTLECRARRGPAGGGYWRRLGCCGRQRQWGIPPRRGPANSPSRPAGEVVLELARRRRRRVTVIVERAWLQTRFPRSETVPIRQDQLVVQFVTRGRQLEIKLPRRGAQSRSRCGCSSPIPTARRNSPKKCRPRGAGGRRGMLTLPLPAGTGAGRYVVSLQYRVASPGAGHGSRSIAAPALWRRRLGRSAYWQLLLPPQEHSSRLRTVHRRVRLALEHNFYYGRQPVMGQAELGDWVGLPQTASERRSRYKQLPIQPA